MPFDPTSDFTDPAPDATATRRCPICGAIAPEAGLAFCSFCEGWDGVPDVAVRPAVMRP
jgi:hypothetical protein